MAIFLSIDKGSVQFSSVAQLCPTLCDTMNRSTPGLPVQHQLPELLRLASIFLLLLECLLHEGWHDFCCVMSLVRCAFFFFFFFFFFCLSDSSLDLISIMLSSRSLIHSSMSFSLLFIASRLYFWQLNY